MRYYSVRVSGLVAMLAIASSIATAQPMPSLWNPTGSGPVYSGSYYPQATYAQPAAYGQQPPYGQPNPLFPGCQEALPGMQNTVSTASYTPYGSLPVAPTVPAAQAIGPQPPLAAPTSPLLEQSTYTPPPMFDYRQPVAQVVEPGPTFTPGYPNGVAFGGSAGFVGGAELAFLKPYLSDFQRLDIDGFTARFPHNDFEMSPRVWLGYVSATGLGMRGRYWQFDHHPDSETVTFDDDWGLPTGDEFSMVGRLKMESIDSEVYQRVQMGCWSGNFGVGVRYGAIRHDSYLTYKDAGGLVETTSVYDHLDAVGPTVLAELRRPVGTTGISLVGSARGCLLFGEERFTRTADLLTALTISEKRDTTMGVGEIQLGVDWSCALSGGGRLFIQALFEGQIWSTMSEIGGADLELFGIGGGDLGMMGFSAGAGITR